MRFIFMAELYYEFIKPEIGVDLTLLLITLEKALYETRGVTIGIGYVPLFTSYFNARLEHSGHCPVKINRLNDFSPQLKVALSLIPSHNLEDHSACTRSKCFALRTIPEMEMTHSPGSCTCNLAAFDPECLGNILKAGGNPGLVRNFDVDGQAVINIVDVWAQPYVAISHVW